MPVSPNFVKGRAQLHERRRVESAKVAAVVKEFLKLVDGNVSHRELDKLCHRWSMPGINDYVVGDMRAELKFPHRKPQRGRNASPTAHWRKLCALWDELMRATPESQLPGHVDPARRRSAPTPTEEPAVTIPPPTMPSPQPVAEPRYDLRGVPTKLLLAEIERRRQEAEALLKELGPSKIEQALLPFGTRGVTE